MTAAIRSTRLAYLALALTLTTACTSVAQDAANGAATFEYECGYCHLPGGTGTIMLGRRLGADNALLTSREDLTAEYIEAVVRNGVVSMPRLTRVELTDAELASIVAFLTRSE